MRNLRYFVAKPVSVQQLNLASRIMDKLKASKPSPYRLSDVRSVESIRACRVRFEATMKKLRHEHLGNFLDVGETNALGELLGASAYVDCDLDWEWPSKIRNNWATITCFEVLEHVQNPLMLANQMWLHLRPGGRLYLTTPVRWWMGKYLHHFHEFDEGQLYLLLETTHFKILRFERMRAYTWCWKFFGIRPVIRWLRDLLLGQCFFVIAEKPAKAGAGGSKKVRTKQQHLKRST